MKHHQVLFLTIFLFAVAEATACETCGGKDKGEAKPSELTSGVNSWQAFKPGEPMVEPEVRKSVNGVLETTITAKYAYRNVGGYRLFTRTYDGKSPGPTLRVKPGDKIKIKLVNDLPPNRDAMPALPAIPHQFNRTNFHSHGLHVSPSGIADNVMRSMEPGGTYDVELDIPKDHIAGTNWYHPHSHGSSDIQVASGMVGALVIEGDFADVPEIANAKERTLVLTEAVFDSFGMVEDFDTLFPETAPRFLMVNGQREPTITMRPGEVQRWRVVHAGWQDDLFLELEKHEMHAIARDGIPLAKMGLTPPPAPSDPTKMLMAPGQRVDVLVKAGEPGTYLLRALPYNQGYPSPTGPLARIVVEGDPLPMNLPAELPKPVHKHITDEELTGQRTITFSVVHPEVDATSRWQEFQFMIDGKRFDPDRIDQRVKLGAVEEWTVVNEHTDDHVFHIHVNDFELIKVNGVPLKEPVWLDTTILPSKGSFTFRTRFEDYTGVFVMHCHMMNHEEMGMMQTVEVYDPSKPEVKKPEAEKPAEAKPVAKAE